MVIKAVENKKTSSKYRFKHKIKLILTAREGNMGNCHPEKTNVDRGEAEGNMGNCHPEKTNVDRGD